MNRELSFHNNYILLYRDAEASSERQAAQIEELFRQKIDLLIVTPNEVNPLTAVIEKVFDAGIPVVVVDRKIGSKKYTAFIGASNYEVGQDAGNYAASLLKGKGNIIEIAGLPAGASPAIERHNGFMDAISSDPGLKEGVNTYAGKLTYKAVADDQGLEYSALDDLLGLTPQSSSKAGGA